MFCNILEVLACEYVEYLDYSALSLFSQTNCSYNMVSLCMQSFENFYFAETLQTGRKANCDVLVVHRHAKAVVLRPRTHNIG